MRGVGRDVVYSLTLATTKHVVLTTIAPVSGSYDTVLHVRTTCTDAAPPGSGLSSRRPGVRAC